MINQGEKRDRITTPDDDVGAHNSVKEKRRKKLWSCFFKKPPCKNMYYRAYLSSYIEINHPKETKILIIDKASGKSIIF